MPTIENKDKDIDRHTFLYVVNEKADFLRSKKIAEEEGGELATLRSILRAYEIDTEFFEKWEGTKFWLANDPEILFAPIRGAIGEAEKNAQRVKDMTGVAVIPISFFKINLQTYTLDEVTKEMWDGLPMGEKVLCELGHYPHMMLRVALHRNHSTFGTMPLPVVDALFAIDISEYVKNDGVADAVFFLRSEEV